MKKIFTIFFLVLFYILCFNFGFSQVQVLKLSNYKTQDNTPNLIPNSATPTEEPYYGYCWTLERARARFGDSVYYYEFSARATWWRGGSSLAYGGDYRQTSRLTGETINGNYATWVFDVDTSTSYLVYNYILTSGNAASDCYFKLERFGESVPADSFRFDMRRNNVPRYKKNPTDPDVTYGVWVPLSIVKLYKGVRSFYVTVGADTLTGFSLIRADAVRILKSDFNGPDMEFGRRSYLGFDSIRVEEEYGDVPLGEYQDKDFPIYNLGNKDLVISDLSFVFNTGRFSSATNLPVTIKPGEKGSVKIRFRPYQEEFVADTLVITSNDPQELQAKLPLSGSGMNYYFIMNGSDPNVAEPHYKAPYDSPQDLNKPGYTEGAENTPSPGWINSGSVSPFNFPVPGGNLKSRVNTGTGYTAWAQYKFTLPPDKFGYYIIDYSGPFWSTNATSNATFTVITPFVTDTQSAVFSQEQLQIDGFWRQIGGTKVYYLNGGAPTIVRFTNEQRADEYLRADLLRIRKVPTAPTISCEYGFKTLYFGDVSVYESERIKNPLSNKKKIEIGSNGESLIRIDTIYLKNGWRREWFYKIIDLPKFPVEVPAVNGKFSFTIELTPKGILSGYVDTVVIRSNASNFSVLTVRIYGSGIGDLITADDKDVSTYFYPSDPVDYANITDPTTLGKWYYYQGGYNDRRIIGPIYFLKGDPDKNNLAYVEWYPEFPLKQGMTGVQADSFNVYVVSPAGSSNSNPRAKYIVYEYGGKPTEIIVSQNAYDATANPTGVPTTGELYLGRFQFLRGGKDSHGSGSIFGHIELYNDTALVSDFYKNVIPNPAKRDTHVTRADAILFREAADPGFTYVVEPNIPTTYSLSQNFPNPFNPSTQIKFSVPSQGKVELKIYDILGREVLILLNEHMMPGNYVVNWNGKNSYGANVSSGTYFYRIIADNYIKTKKMLLLK